MSQPQDPLADSLASKMWVRYLEMRSPPSGELRVAGEPPVAGASVERLETIDIERYKSLYRLIGDPWHWTARRRMRAEQLEALFADPRYELRVLEVHGRQCGLAELDFRTPPDVELVYFGLSEDCIGRGLGRWLMSVVLEGAWSGDTARLWLHTCELDHPAAFDFYRRSGFDCYREIKARPPGPEAALHW